MHGLDAFVLIPPFSAIVSLLLVAGCDAMGLWLIGFSGLRSGGSGWLRFQCPVLGAALMAMSAYPIALAGFASYLVLRVLAWLLVLCGTGHLLLFCYRLKRTEGVFQSAPGSEPFSFVELFVFLLFALLTVYALAPVTNADSLDYHLGVALKILESGTMPLTPEWFHSRIAGSGEVLNAVGLAAGSEQFGAILQLAGLAALCAIVFGFGDSSRAWRGLLTLAAASSPVMMFLVGSAKPQLLPAAMTTVALVLALQIRPEESDKDGSPDLTFALVSVLAMTASQMKFCYLLGGGVAGFVGLVGMARSGRLGRGIVIALSAFLVLILPPLLWKMNGFGGGFFETLLTPLPGGWPGSDLFEVMLRNYADSPMWFPLSLLVPSGPGTISTVIGAGLLLTLFLRPFRSGPECRILVSAALFVGILSAILGPPSSRSYLEPFFWLMIALSASSPPGFFIQHGRWLKRVLLIQACGFLVMVVYGIFSTSPGFVSAQGRRGVMEKMADGYRVMKWVDATLPGGAVLLSGHRSMALVPRRAVSLDWFRFAADPVSSGVYLDRLRSEGVSHLLVIGDDYRHDPVYDFFSSCLGTTVYGPGEGFRATRNPFNRGERYRAWLFEFDSSLLPGCVSSGKSAGERGRMMGPEGK